MWKVGWRWWWWCGYGYAHHNGGDAGDDADDGDNDCRDAADDSDNVENYVGDGDVGDYDLCADDVAILQKTTMTMMSRSHQRGQ